MNVVRSRGISYHVCFGHSVGEVAAAWASGALDLSSAVEVIKRRSIAQGRTRGYGRMAAVGLSEQEFHAIVEANPRFASIELAGINGPSAVTLAGSQEPLLDLEQMLTRSGTSFRILDLDYPFHSRLMDGVKEEILSGLCRLQPREGNIQFVSTVTGEGISGNALDADYWWRNIREPVQFNQAARTVLNSGTRIFLEIGPHPVLGGYLAKIVEASSVSARPLGTLKRNQDSAIMLERAFDTAIVNGARLDLDIAYPSMGRPTPRVQLPNYQWQRVPYALAPTSESYHLIDRRSEHPLLGYRLRDVVWGWENHVDPTSLNWLADHVIDGAIVYPAAGFVEIALAAARARFGGAHCAVQNLDIHAPLVFQHLIAKRIRVTLEAETLNLLIESCNRCTDEIWTRNVTGRILQVDPLIANIPNVAVAQSMEFAECRVWNAEQLYLATAEIGITYGQDFRWVRSIRVSENEARAELRPPATLIDAAAGYLIHPTALDGGFQALLALMAGDEETNDHRAAYLPVHIGRIDCLSNAVVRTVTVTLEKRSAHSLVASVTYYDVLGRAVVHLGACRFRRVNFVRTDPIGVDRLCLIRKPKEYSGEVVATDLGLPSDVIGCGLAKLRREKPISSRADHLQQFVPLIDVLAASYAMSALESPDMLGTDGIPKEGGPEFRGLLKSWLLEDGLVIETEHGLVRCDADCPSSDSLWASMFARSPSHLSELSLLACFGKAVPAMLTHGATVASSLRLDNFDLLDHYYDSSPTWQHINELVLATVEQAILTWSKERKLRILEVCDPRAPFLRPLVSTLRDHCDYWLVASETQLHSGDRFRNIPIHVVTLNAGRKIVFDPVFTQLQHFDVVVVNNCYGIAPYQSELIEALSSLMSRHGLMLIAEGPSSRLTDLIYAGQRASFDEPSFSEYQAKDAESILNDSGFDSVVSYLEDGFDLRGMPRLVAGRWRFEDLQKHPILDRRRWLIIDACGEQQELVSSIGEELNARGQEWVQIGLSDFVLESYREGVEGPTGVAELVFIGIRSEPSLETLHADELMEKQRETSLALSHAVRAMRRHPATRSTRLWVITSGASPAALNAPVQNSFRPDQASLWGLSRVVANEYPELSCHLLDVDPNSGSPAELIVREFIHTDGEDEVMVSNHHRSVIRVAPGLSRPAAREAVRLGPDSPVTYLGFESPGLLRNLKWLVKPSANLGRDQVKIQPSAVGLNFRDVMYAMGLLSDEAVDGGFAGPTLGMELSGRVISVGTDVTRFAVGDEVFGFAPASFSNAVVTSDAAIALRPSRLSVEEAATIPTVFITVYYALHHLARLQPGERVLIHGAAGGVGIAAIQIAKHLGAEIFATAGTAERRDLVRLLGADHVFDSRTIAFADAISGQLGGPGIDVVLNSLAGEAMVRSIDLLSPFGRFIELGKRDFYQNTSIGLRPFRNNITYFGVDADQLLIHQSELTQRLFHDLIKLIQDGVLHALPYRNFPAERIEEAFSYMQHAKQVGKVVVTFPSGLPAQIGELPTGGFVFDSSGSYLIAGGTSGLGFATARWMVNKGVRHVVLVSRSASLTQEDADEAEDWAREGVEVRIEACDLSDSRAVEALVVEINSGDNPLKGVVHSAMTIADGMLENISDEQFMRVLAPKVAGAWNLHRFTEQLALDFFVLYSSATTLFGPPGQSSYVSANAFLESLVHYRRTHGLAGCFMGWGPIRDVGYLSRHPAALVALESRLGTKAITSDEALAALDRALSLGIAGEAVLRVEWEAMATSATIASSPRFRDLIFLSPSVTEKELKVGLRQQIRDQPADLALDMVVQIIRAQIAEILHLPIEKISKVSSLVDINIDSLMAMELGIALEECFGVKLSVMEFAEGATIHSLAARIVQNIGLDVGEEQLPTSNPEAMERFAARHGVTSDAANVEKAAKTRIEAPILSGSQ